MFIYNKRNTMDFVVINKAFQTNLFPCIQPSAVYRKEKF